MKTNNKKVDELVEFVIKTVKTRTNTQHPLKIINDNGLYLRIGIPSFIPPFVLEKYGKNSEFDIKISQSCLSIENLQVPADININDYFIRLTDQLKSIKFIECICTSYIQNPLLLEYLTQHSQWNESVNPEFEGISFYKNVT